ncbi:MAG TPA: hypothetical protein VNN15_07315 [Solirubrobacterales bacterium]|nr:hypothetical protein [Solirubrobacterales bacterium]
MTVSATTKWVLLALVGLAIAIGVAIAAAHLTSQQIGIASESVSAGDALAPSLHVPSAKPGSGGDRGTPSKEGTTTLPAEPPATTTEEVTPPEEKATPPSEGGGDDHGGGGGDGDD